MGYIFNKNNERKGWSEILNNISNNRKDKSYDCHGAKWLDKLHWERLSVKGKSPWKGLIANWIMPSK